MRLFDSIRSLQAFRGCRTLEQWIKKSFSELELSYLARISTNCQLLSIHNVYLDCGLPRVLQSKIHETIITDAHKLYCRYSDDIWKLCCILGKYDADVGPTGLKCLATLELSGQPIGQAHFEMFMVRNAIKQVAIDLQERKSFAGGVQ